MINSLSASDLHSWLTFNPLTRILSGIPQRNIQQELTLPPGMELTTAGVFFGTAPPNSGLYNFTIRATDAKGIYQDQYYSWLITNDFRKSIKFKSPINLPSAEV